MTAGIIEDKVVTFEHGIGLLPGHRSSAIEGRESVNHVSGHLSPMSPGCTEAPSNRSVHPRATGFEGSDCVVWHHTSSTRYGFVSLERSRPRLTDISVRPRLTI
jgi:hypothetical protein